MSRHSLRHCYQLSVDDQHPVIFARDEAFHDDAAAMLPCDIEGGAYLLGGGEVNRDSASVIRIEGLDHHGVADSFGGGNGIVRVLHQPLLGDRKAQVTQDAVGLLFVGGQLDGDVASSAGDG